MSGGVTHWRSPKLVRRVGGKSLRWQDVLHQEKVIDQRAPQPTALHAVAARDTGTAIVVEDTQRLPIRLTLPQEAPATVGVAVGGPAVCGQVGQNWIGGFLHPRGSA